ncbi:saccharopine dehydrogenase NADP-binding domain-containing protein [Nocardioides panacisoli]|uniref:saccharopine dehydrogenase family protein n=1 Tax=Nocardioides panacisoli TaxID=627624 RepID=UPI001C63728A|nr:saccharopine dehydrogenase NADP-binding domain-containing protein [Nocardioides panacisoli]QYJ03527.1 saccharopine dehydrogenase NADP-binding domain-containing protein [Nocardioides panacisoli]
MSDSHRPLRVIAVGGAGSMGRWAVRTIAKLGSASLLTVADIDLERAERVATAVGGACRALRLDATDEAQLRDAFAGHDVVVNTMGPFATFVGPILSAALESDCHYLDINDDWQPTIEAFKFDQEARRRGLHVVVGLGGSPGVTNLCAAHAAARLDVVHELHTGWKLSGATIVDEPGFPAPAASAAVEHWLHQCAQPIQAWVDGAVGTVDPVEQVDLDFPGLGKVTAYTMGHPEPITLPRRHPELRSSLNLQSGPAWLFEYLREVATRFAAGEIDLQTGATMLADPPQPDDAGERSPLPIEWALAIGEKGGNPYRVAVHPRAFHPAKMGGNTGIPLAIGVELLRRGALHEAGVHAPETAIDPREFFDLLAPLTDDSLTDADDLLAVIEEHG